MKSTFYSRRTLPRHSFPLPRWIVRVMLYASLVCHVTSGFPLSEYNQCCYSEHYWIPLYRPVAPLVRRDWPEGCGGRSDRLKTPPLRNLTRWWKLTAPRIAPWSLTKCGYNLSSSGQHSGFNLGVAKEQLIGTVEFSGNNVRSLVDNVYNVWKKVYRKDPENDAFKKALARCTGDVVDTSDDLQQDTLRACNGISICVVNTITHCTGRYTVRGNTRVRGLRCAAV